jgi:outer membrane cobalamin receptor
LQDRMRLLPGIDLTAGVRYDKDDAVVRDTTLPRFSLSWQSDEFTVWKAAWGDYSQFPTDVELNDEFGNPQLTPNLAQHTAISVERKFTREITVRLDAYYKYYTNLVVSPEGLGIYNNSGSGTAKGIELYVNANFGEKFFGWLSYAYSRSERLTPPEPWILYQYDQTNLATVVASYNFTPAWSVGAKLHYNTGPLVKKLLGTSTDPNGDVHGVYSQDYDMRLDDYLRLDIRTDYTFRFEGWKLNLYIEILNFLNRPNPAQILYTDDYTKSQVVDNLPRIPYFGLEAEF